MILLDDVLNLHDASIEDFGGAKGVRDMGLLESALARPFQTFAGEDLYPTAIGESLIINHPFIDGNKRTGMLAVATLLLEYNIIINASESELYQFVIEISTGEIRFAQIVEWLKLKTSSF